MKMYVVASIDDTIVKNYRKKMQCFRHCTDEAIEERKTYSEEQKNSLLIMDLQW